MSFDLKSIFEIVGCNKESKAIKGRHQDVIKNHLRSVQWNKIVEQKKRASLLTAIFTSWVNHTNVYHLLDFKSCSVTARMTCERAREMMRLEDKH